jgi:anti-anti-sigma factor
VIDVNTCALPGAVIRVSVAGEIDMGTAARLDAALAAAVASEDATGVQVDFSGVTFCDSTGVALLERAYAAAARRSLPFGLIDVQPAVARVLAIVGVLEALTGGHRP